MPILPWSQVQGQLDDVIDQHDVKILWAIESGSRAWGFPSPDSDFDCRFIYIRPIQQQLRIDPHRDVIETALTPILDVNGWDIRKALKLLLKGNAVVQEWLASPIVYRGEVSFCADMQKLAEYVGDRCLTTRHYAHLCARQWDRHSDGRDVRLKKLFYALRPAMALRWLRLHPEKAMPPLSFVDTMQAADMPVAISNMISGLIAEKAISREMADGQAPSELSDFIDAELALGLIASSTSEPLLRKDRFEEAHAVLLKWSDWAA